METVLPVIAKSTETLRASQEFPARTPAALGAETIALESLIHHREAVDAGLALELAQIAFRNRGTEFMAVVRDGRVVGLCSRGRLGFIMSSRFGFALYSQQPIETVMVERPLIVPCDTPVRDLLDRALARQGDDFHEEVVLVDEERRLLGLIKVEILAQLQSRLVAEQLDELRSHHETLRRQNLELFQANHAARQSQGLYLGLFASHTLGVALLDLHGGIHEHNARLAELLNLPAAPLTVMSLAQWIAAAERDVFLALLESQTRGAAGSATHEFTLNLPGRGDRLIRCSLGWISETGQICACLDDVTDQRALERNLQRQEKQTLLDTLVGGIAHELNNKLTPIQGFAELLSLEAGPQTGGHIDLITKSVAEAARIIRQLLELSKPAAQLVRLLDLRTVVEETLTILKFQLRETGCEVRTHLPAEPVWVTADAGQLKQVALNLVLNALHALEETEAPVLTVEVRLAGLHAELRVADNGCGISPDNLTRIFDPFFTTKGPERGTGLGLSICFSIARQHGGDITVQSRPGEGAQFTLSLRREMVMAPLLVEETDRLASQAALSALPRGRRVLVVEDEIVLRRLMQEILCSHFGCRVEVAASGAEALAALERGPFDLVLSDIRMPVMNGTELYLWLRELRPELARRFVFITGHPGDNDLEAQIAQWNVPVIAKPFKLARLAEVCRPFLETPALQRATA